MDLELSELARRIVPELADGPLYVVTSDDDGLPAQYQAGFVGLFSSWLDVALSNWLRSRDQWRGRGPAVVVNSKCLRTDADRDAGADRDFADRLYQGRLLAVLAHELAHVVESPVDRSEYFDLADASQKASEAVVRWSAEHIPPAAPWHGHGGGWLRVLCHVQDRAEEIINRRLPTPWVCGSGYGLSTFLAYRNALGDEPERLRDQTFETIRSTAPPVEFVRLWRRDVKEWFSSITEPTAEATTEVVQGLRLFT